MAQSHTPEEIRRIARKFAAAEAIDTLKRFIRYQDAKIARLNKHTNPDIDPFAQYAKLLGHRAAKAQAEALMREIPRKYGVKTLEDEVMRVIEEEDF